MNNQMDKGLFFLILSMGCVWLILDQAMGKKRLQGFLQTLFPFMRGTSSGSVEMSHVEQNESAENAPSSSAMGQSGKKTDRAAEMEKDNAYFYSIYIGKSPMPYAPAQQAKYAAWVKKWSE